MLVACVPSLTLVSLHVVIRDLLMTFWPMLVSCTPSLKPLTCCFAVSCHTTGGHVLART